MDLTQVLYDYFLEAWPWVVWVLLLVFLDWILGVIVAVLAGDFKWEYIGQFLETNILLKLVAYIFFSMIITIGTGLPGEVLIPEEILVFTLPVVFGILVVDIVLGSIVGHMITLGLVPEFLADILNRLGVDPSRALTRKMITLPGAAQYHEDGSFNGKIAEDQLVLVKWPAVDDKYQLAEGADKMFIPRQFLKRE